MSSLIAFFPFPYSSLPFYRVAGTTVVSEAVVPPFYVQVSLYEYIANKQCDMRL